MLVCEAMRLSKAGFSCSNLSVVQLMPLIKQPRLRAESLPNASLSQRLVIVAELQGNGQTIIWKPHSIATE